MRVQGDFQNDAQYQTSDVTRIQKLGPYQVTEKKISAEKMCALFCILTITAIGLLTAGGMGLSGSLTTISYEASLGMVIVGVQVAIIALSSLGAEVVD